MLVPKASAAQPPRDTLAGWLERPWPRAAPSFSSFLGNRVQCQCYRFATLLVVMLLDATVVPTFPNRNCVVLFNARRFLHACLHVLSASYLSSFLARETVAVYMAT